MEQSPRYIGFTDVYSRASALALRDLFHRHGGSADGTRLHVGNMMSYKTLHGQPTEWAAIFPSKEQLAAIFPPTGCLNVLHYADYSGIDILDSLRRAAAYGGPNLHGLQLDMTWPKPAAVREFKTERPDLFVILQVGPRALDAVEYSPWRVLTLLDEYDDAIQGVLFDQSLGRGLGLDASTLMPFVRAVRLQFPDLTRAMAGGLGPDTLHLLEPILSEDPGISWDAQGQLHLDGNTSAPVALDRIERYLTGSIELVHRYPRT